MTGVPRTRETAYADPVKTANRVIYKYDKYDNLTDTLEASAEYIPMSTSSIMDDVEVPDFHRRSKQGEIFCNPMCKTTETVKTTPLNFYNFEVYKEWSYRQRLSGSYCYGTAGENIFSRFDNRWDDDLIAETSALAVTKAWANTDLSDAALLVTVGEMEETVDMGKDLMFRTIKYLKWLKKKRYIKLLKELDPVNWPDIWLSIRYGLRPLIGDALTLIDVLSEEIVHAQRQTFRGYAIETISSDRVHSSLNDESYLWWNALDIQQDQNTTFVVECRAGVLTEVLRSTLAHALGLYNPVQAVYDLTTLSFMVDWILNVGDTLASFSPKAGLQPLCSWVTTTATMECTTHVTGFKEAGSDPDVQFFGTIGNGTDRFTKTEVKRTPSPERRVLPQFDVNLSVAKLIDMVLIGRNLSKKVLRW